VKLIDIAGLQYRTKKETQNAVCPSPQADTEGVLDTFNI